MYRLGTGRTGRARGNMVVVVIVVVVGVHTEDPVFASMQVLIATLGQAAPLVEQQVGCFRCNL